VSNKKISKEWEEYLENANDIEDLPDVQLVPNKKYKFNIDEALNNMDLKFGGYLPSRDAIEFFSLMRLVQGQDFEVENSLMHYFLVDLVFGNIKRHQYPYSKEIQDSIRINNRKIAIMCSRGLAKSTVITAFLPIYLAIKGKMPNFGDVMFVVGFGDSQQAGAKVQANTIRDICEDSLFCKEYFEKMRFTDEECEFLRKQLPGENKSIKSRSFMYKVKGAAGGSVRGIRYKTERPQCHVRGTIVTTEYGTYPIEEHPIKAEGFIENGYEIKVRGLTESEFVSKDHKYWAKKCTNDQVWCRTSKKLVKNYIEYEACWEEASKLTNRHWIGSMIDYTEINPPLVECVKYYDEIIARDSKGRILKTRKISKLEKIQFTEFDNDDWWWLYGLWLGDGTISNSNIIYTIANTQEKTIGKKVCSILDSLGKKYSIQRFGSGCYNIVTSDTDMSNWLKSQKSGNSIKNMPDWVMRITLNKQKNLLLGYIAADGYIDNKKVSQQVRINSVNLNVLKQLQVISSRLGLPTYIRNTKRSGVQVFNSTNKEHNINHQWELRLVENVKQILNIDVSASTKVKFKQVHIENGMLWRQVKSVEETKDLDLIPIQCNNRDIEKVIGENHAYSTLFGISKNCIIFDDIIKNEADANSKIIMKKLKSMMYADAENALGGKKGKIIAINTPFNKNDPVYQALESGTWTPVCIPMCEKIDDNITKKEFVGAWEPMHSYERVKERYEDALGTNSIREFNQELMLRISNEEDRLVPESLIQFIDTAKIKARASQYNWYLTTDYTSTGSKGSDFSGAALWAVASSGDIFLVDLTLKKMELEEQYRTTFKMVESVFGNARWVDVGVEVDGQQNIHIYSLKQMMVDRNTFFSFARQKGAKIGSEGIRSRLEGGNKHWRFRQMLPLFQNRKIWFNEALKDTPDMRELMEEIKYTSYTSIGSKHDDGLDLISQINMIDIIYPAKEFENAEAVKKAKRNSPMNEYIWGIIDDDTESTAYDSYSE